MFFKVTKLLASNFTTEDFRIQVRVLLPTMSVTVTWHRLCVGLSDVSYQKGIIQGHLVHRYASTRDPALCSRRIVFLTILSLNVSTHTIFPYYMSVKIYIEGLFLMFLVSMLHTGCYVKQMKSMELFNPSLVIFMRAWVNSSTIVNICWLINTFSYQCVGFQVHLKSILVYNLKSKSDFDQNLHITQ